MFIATVLLVSICQRSSCLAGMVENSESNLLSEPPSLRARSRFSYLSQTERCVQEGKANISCPQSTKDCHRSRKEVFQPHFPVRLPCYDLAPITSFALGRSSRSRTSGTPGFHGLTGGVYKARERIHRAMADARLLANPASWGRVADPSPN